MPGRDGPHRYSTKGAVWLSRGIPGQGFAFTERRLPPHLRKAGGLRHIGAGSRFRRFPGPPRAGSLDVMRAHAPAAAALMACLFCAAVPAYGQEPGPLRAPDVMFVPTPQEVVEAMLRLADVTDADVVYDLGSGDGRIPITAARQFGARGVGVELNPDLIKEANDNRDRAGVRDKVTFLNQDLFETDLRPATVITLYLLREMNVKLMPSLKRLKPGTRIVAHSFGMGAEWPPERVEQVSGKSIFFWVVK